VTMRWERRAVGLVALVLALGFPRVGSAQVPGSAAPVNVSLEEALQRAVERAPRLEEGRARESAAKSTYDAKRAMALPSGTVSSSVSRNNHVPEVQIGLPTGGTRVLFPDIPDSYRFRGELFVPVYAFGRVQATLDSAQSDIQAASADLKATEADVRLDTARAYWFLVTSIETIGVLEESLVRADAYVADVKARVDAGVLPPNDLLSAQAQRARQAVRLLQARNGRSFAELDLGRLIGEPAGTRLVPTTAVDRSSPVAVALESLTEAALVAKALGGRPESVALLARSSGLRSSAEAAIANLRPYITGVAALEPARPNVKFVPPTRDWRTSWVLGANFTWPLFDSGRSKAESAALTSSAKAVDARRHEFEDMVAFEVRQLLLDLESNRAALSAAGEAVTAAAEADRVVGERFRAGVATSTEVLDAQVALLEAQVEQTRLQASIRLTEARLIRAVGVQ
jgi:outer membrane protein